MSFETMKHEYAKNIVANWFRDAAKSGRKGRSCGGFSTDTNRAGPNFGVWTEYPISIDKFGKLAGVTPWDEPSWADYDNSNFYNGTVEHKSWKDNYEFYENVPTYDQLIKYEHTPILIFDVAVHNQGAIALAIEIIYKNGISNKKRDYIKKTGIETIALKADWVLSQKQEPEEFEILFTING